MKILVTGSSGFIGSNLVKSLRQQEHTVIEADIKQGIDLKSPTSVLSLPDVDLVYHLATTNYTGGFYTSPFSIMESSIITLYNIIQRYKDTPIIYSSSCETYAGGVDLGITPLPTPEDVPLVIDDIKNPRWSYGSSKIAGEAMIVAANVEFGTPYKIIRYHNVYGVDQKDHFIPEFIARCTKGDYTLYGGDETRSFCYIDDAIQGTLLVQERAAWGSTTHIGNDVESKISDVAQQILDNMNISSPLDLKPGKLGSVKRRLPDITKLRSLGYTPKWTLEQGIKEVVNGIVSK
jgi:UDP-glucose 4-epimerase